ncbi:MAG: 5-keto-L-gluconate epimerase [Deltaproteobacteria bacterium]|nr:5-keto-L-gluconate epimerase [Deltaproteobacteria bacterium]
MQKCIAVSTPGARFSALAVKERFRDSIRKVAELGYDAVELHIRDPHAIDADEIAGLLHQYRLPVPTIGTGQAYGEEALSFADPDPVIRRNAVQRIRDQMDLASRLGIPQVTIGLIRGTVKPGADQGQAEERVRACLAECLDYNPAVTLILEPLNRYETSLYNDTASAKEVIDRIGRPNLKMLIDTFHMNIEEPDIIESILAVRDYIAHVHFADSNRWAPGCGHIDFQKIVHALRKIRYRGAICAEILPKPSPDECLRLTIEYFKKLGL